MAEQLAKVRSFKRRGKRITSGQESAYQSGWPKWGIDDWNQLSSLEELAEGRRVVLDIGYGMGETTAVMAAERPNEFVVAIDIHRPGAGALLREIEFRGLANVRLLDGDVTEVMPFIPEGSLDEIRLYFPDPWPKSRHHKRRLVQERFVRVMTRKLTVGGWWHCATDWEPYAEWMLEVFVEIENLEGGIVAKPDYRPTTRFEGQGIRKGHRVTDLIFIKK